MSPLDDLDDGDLALFDAIARPFREQAERHRRRSLVFAIILMSGVLFLAAYPPERIAIVAGIMALSNVVGAREIRRGARGLKPWMCLAPVSIVAVTGGIRSPLFPAVVFGLAPYLFVASRRTKTARWMWGGAGAIAILAALPEAITGPPFPQPLDAVITGVTLVIALVKVGSVMRRSLVLDELVDEEIRRLRGDLLHEAHERSRTFEAVGAKVGHELKTPLAAVRVLLDLELRRASDELSRERLGRAIEETKRLTAIVNDYLVLAKPVEAIEVAAYDLASVASEVVTLFQESASRAEVRLELVQPPGAIAMQGDRRRLREALVNLVANAIEASRAGQTVKLVLEASASRVRVTVVDEGRGIPAHLIPRIGTAFFTTREGGTGLGIVLARMVVMQHGGRLSFDTAEGRGTSVCFWLPRRAETVSAASEPSGASTPLLEEAALG
ncbi:MAG: HAMP domain-containing sensor histidine kinase [Sandaracinus sp.]